MQVQRGSSTLLKTLISPDKTNNSRSISEASSDSSRLWKPGGHLPPPPNDCNNVNVNISAVPAGPAKAWDSDLSDDDSADEDAGEISQLIGNAITRDSDTNSDLETESECATEIYVPQLVGRHPNPMTVKQRMVKPNQRHSEVIPSVSSDNLCRSPAPVKISTTSEDIATNIDSGISNETSHVQSQDGTVILRKRTLSASSSSHYSSSYSCGSRGQIPSPNLGQAQKLDEIAVYMREAKISRVVSFLSACYAALLITIGLTLTAFSTANKFPDSTALEGFYMYLYGLGIFFLIYVYSHVVKDMRRSETERKQSLANNILRPESAKVLICQLHTNDVVPMVGSLFLRVAVVLFCIGSSIDTALKFGANLVETCGRNRLLYLVQPLSQCAFMIVEVYFVFDNTKMCIRQYPIVAKFGLMHLIATNLCTWMSSTIREVCHHVKVTRTFQRQMPHNLSHYVLDNSVNSLLTPDPNCTHNSLLSEISTKAKPYTYPCSVQFCLLVTCIIYVMWKQVDPDSDTQCTDCKEHTKRDNLSSTRTIDCSSTGRGLFLGIITLVGVICSLIVFFVLTMNNYQDIRATLVIHNCRIATYLLMSVISVVVILKLRILDHNSCRLTILEDILLAICVLALFSYDIIGLISGIFFVNRIKGILVLATSVTEFFQSVIQMCAIVMGLKLSTSDTAPVPAQTMKPGRECVTFLVVANISLWVLSLFNEVVGQDFETQTLLLGQLVWGICKNMFSPLVMFYHLFSAACFVDIWYNAYRSPTTPFINV